MDEPEARGDEFVLQEGLLLALSHLHGCLTDADERVMLLAMHALRQMITKPTVPLKKAWEALRKSSYLTHYELDVFRHASRPGSPSALDSATVVSTAAKLAIDGARREADARAVDPLAESLWRTERKTTDVWLCDLAQVLP